MLEIDSNICCGICAGELTVNGKNKIKCIKCGFESEISNEMLLLNKTNFYFGEIAQDLLNSINSCIKKNPNIIEELKTNHSKNIPQLSDFLRQYIFSHNRTSYIDYLLTNYAMTSKMTSLDIGSGYGAVGAQFEKAGFKNYYVELTGERLEFSKLKNSYLGLNNGVYICGGDHFIPIKDSSMSVVSCIGVLEWVPSSIDGLDPLEVQKIFLKELYQKLDIGGYLLLGIENRYAYKYILGRPDDHTGLRFITFLPRSLANLYSKCVSKKNYRNYLHGFVSLSGLLSEVGFVDVEILHPYPDYRFAETTKKFSDNSGISTQLDCENVGSMPRLIVKIILKIMNRLNVFKYFAYSYLVIAKKG